MRYFYAHGKKHGPPPFTAVHKRCDWAALGTPDVTSRSFTVNEFNSSYTQLVYYIPVLIHCDSLTSGLPTKHIYNALMFYLVVGSTG